MKKNLKIKSFLLVGMVLFALVFRNALAIADDYLLLSRSGKMIEAVERYWDIPRTLEFHYGSFYTKLSEEDKLKCIQLYSEFVPIYIGKHFRLVKEPSEHVIVETKGKIHKQYADITQKIIEHDPKGIHLVILLRKDGKRKIVDQRRSGVSVSMSIMGLVDSDPNNLPPLPEYMESLIGMIP